MRIFARGFNFSQDGPGNRLVIHLSGCNMRCIWCSNPEGFSPLCGEEITPEALVAEAKRARAMFFEGGGVTFTGGEATLWHEELLSCLKALREEGIHTALETNGTSARLCELLPYIDCLMMDFKHFDDEVLRRFTGLGGETVRKNFEYLCRTGREAHIRIPLIQGFNASSPEGFAAYFSAHDTSHIDFELLPYHEYGKGKWTEEYRVKDGFVSDETVENFRRVLKAHGLQFKKT